MDGAILWAAVGTGFTFLMTLSLIHIYLPPKCGDVDWSIIHQPWPECQGGVISPYFINLPKNGICLLYTSRCV